MTLLLALLGAGAARAQAPVSVAQPPTKGALYADGQTDRWLLGGSWLYRADPGDVGLSQGWWRDVADATGWTQVTVPNAYNASDASATSMSGYVGWYRRDFTLPAGAFPRYVSKADRRWIVRFESVNYRATVWLNGHRLGTHVGASLPFEFDLAQLKTGVNRLIVRVDDRRTGADLPPGPGGQWWNYGGLLREVYLRSVARADIAVAQIRPILRCSSSCTAAVAEQVQVRNVTGARQTVRLTGTYGTASVDFGPTTIAPHATWTPQASIRITHPRLWSLLKPELYRATLTLLDTSGHHLAGYTYLSGIRKISVVGGRLTLNGHPLDLRGVDLHEQSPGEGAALDPTAIGRLIGWVRQLGATVIRAHYPVNPQMLELADRYGLLVWSEVPVFQVNGDYLAQSGWVAQADSFLEQNILANQNHPSVMLWSIGNELPTPATPSEAGYVAGAAKLARRLDPTRPVGMAVSGWPGVACQSAYAPLDAIGYNDYFGWFDAGGGGTDDRDALSPYLDSLRACYPSQAMFVTEFGFDGSRSGPVEERGTYQFQADATAFHLGVFASKPWLSGAIYFALQNYVAFPGYSGGDPFPVSPFNQKGLVDFNGNPKPAFSVVAGIYRQTPQISP